MDWYSRGRLHIMRFNDCMEIVQGMISCKEKDDFVHMWIFVKSVPMDLSERLLTVLNFMLRGIK